MSADAGTRDQLTICSRDCGARCCRYVTVDIPTPRALRDWDRMRWWLAHEGVIVSKDENGWMLHADTRCGNLRPDNTCMVHPHHPDTCRNHDPEWCEYTGPLEYELELRGELDLARYIERRKLKRAAPVARAIRRAEARRREPPAPRLVPLEGLPPGTPGRP